MGSDPSPKLGEKSSGNAIDESLSNGTSPKSHQMVTSTPKNKIIPVNNAKDAANVASKPSMVGEKVSEKILAQIGPIIANSVKEALEEDDSILETGEPSTHKTIERMRWLHKVEHDDFERIYKDSLSQQRAALDCEHQLDLLELRNELRDVKQKTWCIICRNEAYYYCCWNTAYCNVTCQQAHWLSHRTKCAHQSLPSSDASQTVNVPIVKRSMPELMHMRP